MKTSIQKNKVILVVPYKKIKIIKKVIISYKKINLLTILIRFNKTI